MPKRRKAPVMKLMVRNKAFIAIAAALAAIGCNRVPDEVIEPEAMASLMADMRVANAVVSVNASDYRNPAAKEALKQALFARHGVTEEQYDSSLMWYGHNIGIYQEVTDRSIEILEQRLEEAGSAATAAAMSVAGDSVDIWDGPRLFTFDRRSASDYLTFNLEPDRNWDSGDVYTWHARFVMPAAKAQWTITAEYDDGVVEMLHSSIYTTAPGRQEITFFTDSTRRARSISGWLQIEPDNRRPAVIDSVGLIRRRKYDAANGRRLQRRIIPRATNADTTVTR